MSASNVKSTLWVEKWRPMVVDDTILPENVKSMFKNFVADGDFPNLLLTGDSGVGKTTIAKAMVNELGWSSMIINASSMLTKEFRGDLTTFVTTRSLNNPNSKKVVILDEADGLTGTLQGQLKAFMEEHSHAVRFIMTANLPSKLIKPLRSRCTEVDFHWDKKQQKPLMKEFAQRLVKILKTEGVEFELPAIGEIAKNHFPDFRKVINEMQRYSAINGKIDIGILDTQTGNYEELYSALHDKNFKRMLTWVVNNKGLGEAIYSELMQNGLNRIDPASTPDYVRTVGLWNYRHGFSPDPQIPLTCCMTEIIQSVNWK